MVTLYTICAVVCPSFMGAKCFYTVPENGGSIHERRCGFGYEESFDRGG